MFDLSPFAPDAEVTRVLLQHNIRLQYSIGVSPDDPRYRYTVDRHYELYVLTYIETLEQALAFCDALDADHASDPLWSKRTCNKADQIRQRLSNPFWQTTPDRIRAAIAPARRVGCWEHETGSFAKRA